MRIIINNRSPNENNIIPNKNKEQKKIIVSQNAQKNENLLLCFKRLQDKLVIETK